MLRAQCDPAEREPMGHSYGSHSETKDIEKALWARFWGYKGQIPLFLGLHFFAAEERGHDQATPRYAIYALKALRK